MKLHIYEHCPFCARARMIFGLKNIPVELSVIMEGDAETPTRLIGRKVVPILEKDDGSVMAESMDIVRYVDSLSSPPVVTDPPRADVDAWVAEARPVMLPLAIPRFTKGSFKEISTDASRQSYREREEKAFGDLEAMMRDTPETIRRMDVLLAKLEPLLKDHAGISPSDLIVFSTLRSLSIVRGLRFPPGVKRFMDGMEQRTGLGTFADQAM